MAKIEGKIVVIFGITGKLKRKMAKWRVMGRGRTNVAMHLDHDRCFNLVIADKAILTM